MGTAWDLSMENGMARRIMRPGKKRWNLILTLSPSLLFRFTLLSLSHKLVHTNTFQSRRDMTADQCEHSQPHKWKWLICHSSILGGISLSFTQGEWTPFGWRPSLLIAHHPKALRLENIFCVYDKAPNHSLFVCACSFFVFDIYVWYNVSKWFLIFFPIFNRQQCALLIDMSSERGRAPGNKSSKWKR